MMKLAGCEGLARRGDEGEASSERDLKAVAARSHRVAVLNFAPKKKKKVRGASGARRAAASQSGRCAVTRLQPGLRSSRLGSKPAASSQSALPLMRCGYSMGMQLKFRCPLSAGAPAAARTAGGTRSVGGHSLHPPPQPFASSPSRLQSQSRSVSPSSPSSFITTSAAVLIHRYHIHPQRGHIYPSTITITTPNTIDVASHHDRPRRVAFTLLSFHR